MGKMFDAAVPTTSYAGQIAYLSKKDRGDAVFYVDYIKGTETSLEMRVDHSNKFDVDNSEAWFQESKPDSVNEVKLVEYKFTATGKYRFVTPGYPGEDKVRVSLKRTGGTGGFAETTEVTIVNTVFDVVGAAKSWAFRDAANLRRYVWYRVTDGVNFPQTDPGGGGTGYMVDLLLADTATVIATKTAAVLNPLAEVNATSLAAVVTLTNAFLGAADDAVDVDAGVTVLVTVQGAPGIGCATVYIQE